MPKLGLLQVIVAIGVARVGQGGHVPQNFWHTSSFYALPKVKNLVPSENFGMATPLVVASCFMTFSTFSREI